MEYNSALIKVDWLAAYIAPLREVGDVLSLSFGVGLAYNLHSSPANGNQGPIPEGMFVRQSRELLDIYREEPAIIFIFVFLI